MPYQLILKIKFKRKSSFEFFKSGDPSLQQSWYGFLKSLARLLLQLHVWVRTNQPALLLLFISFGSSQVCFRASYDFLYFKCIFRSARYFYVCTFHHRCSTYQSKNHLLHFVYNSIAKTSQKFHVISSTPLIVCSQKAFSSFISF